MSDTNTPKQATVTDHNSPLFGKVFKVIEEGIEFVKTEFKDGEMLVEKFFHRNQVEVAPVTPVEEVK